MSQYGWLKDIGEFLGQRLLSDNREAHGQILQIKGR
jgi:hypothetical protein